MDANAYQVYDIEFTKEQYEVLKQIYKHTSIDDSILHNFFSPDTLRRSINFLEKHNFIVRPEYFNPDTGRHEGNGDGYEITDKGINACMLITQHHYEFIKKFLLSRVCDIAVSFLTSLITTYVLNHLW